MTDAVRSARYNRMIAILSGDSASPCEKLSCIVYNRDVGVIDQAEAERLARKYLSV